MAAVTKFSVSNNDTLFIKTYYKDGTLKEKGIKVHNLKQDKWLYYNTNGFPYKIENYKNGKLLKTLELGDANE